MLNNNLLGFGIFLGYFVVAGLPPILLRMFFKMPFEITRKMYHMVIALSILPLTMLFRAWYMAVFAVLAFLGLVYPILTLVERSAVYQRFSVERNQGEFKSSFIVVQLSIALVIAIFWGGLGSEGRYLAVVAILAWGFGDAAAALVGKTVGRRRIRHPWVDGKKTYEGTLAMYLVAGLAILFTLRFYGSHNWLTSLAVAALVAPISAAVELVSRRGMDTITVPISSGLTALVILIIFSLLGG